MKYTGKGKIMVPTDNGRVPVYAGNELPKDHKMPKARVDGLKAKGVLDGDGSVREVPDMKERLKIQEENKKQREERRKRYRDAREQGKKRVQGAS